MRQLRQFFCALILVCLPQMALSAPIESFADIIERVSPAVVNISTTQMLSSKDIQGEGPSDLFEFFERELGRELGVPERKRKTKSLGSGFLISADGYIVTNYHVVEDAEDIEVLLGDGSEKIYKAKVAGRDKRSDLALIKIEATKALSYLTFGNSEVARVGDWVVAIGGPFGLASTSTAGIISAKGRYLNNQYSDYIQTDAAINRGNSGGPMLNMQGEVIGINTVIISPSGGSIGIGFAIPSAQVQPVLEQLRAKGEVVRGYLGVRIQPVNDEMAQTMGLNAAGGALIAEVTPNSPAANAKLQVGDIVTKLGGIVVPNSNKLSQMVAATPVGTKVELEVFRNRAYITLHCVIGKLVPEADDNTDNRRSDGDSEENNKGSIEILDMRVRNLDDATRKRYRVGDGVNGIVVTNVKQEGVAANTKIRVGDVIVQLNQDKVSSINDFKDKISTLRKLKQKNAALLIANGLGAYFIVINLEK